MSNEDDSFRSYFFRILTIESELENLKESGELISSSVPANENNKVDSLSLDDFPHELKSKAAKMAQAYMAFFCFENSVRNLVSKRLAEQYGEKWWSEKVPDKIQKTVNTRISDDAKKKWHSPRSTTEIGYCDFGDLCSIIVNNWNDFSFLFNDQDWIRTRLNDLEHSRNVIAHNNLLGVDDITRIQTFLKDWIKQVG